MSGSLTLYVARTTLGDCTNGGITSSHNRLTLVGTVSGDRRTVVPIPDGVPGADPSLPAVALENSTGFSVHLVPVSPSTTTDGYVRSGDWYTSGGNFASTTDSRFSEAVRRALGAGSRFYGAVAVHDRREDYPS